MTLIDVPRLPRTADIVLREAFASFDCPSLGGPSERGWSSQADFLRCPYRYQLKHIRHMRPRDMDNKSKNLDIGSYTHAALAVHYAALLPEGYPGQHPNVPSADDLFAAVDARGGSIEALSEARRLFDGYIENYSQDTFVMPVAVEMPVGDVHIHTSRLDLVTWVEDGIHDGLWICDHKTASSHSDFEAWAHDGEILGEMYSWRLSQLDGTFGAPASGVCINVLVKTRVPTFQRLWLTFRPEQIDEYAKHQAHWRTMVDFYNRSGYWPKSMYGCAAKFGRCRFWQHCCALDDSYLEQVLP